MSEKIKREVSMIDKLEMLGFLKSNGTGCRFVGLTIKTPVVKIKVGNPWGAGAKTKNGLYKISRKSGVINKDFAAAVARNIAASLGVKPAEVEYESGDTWYKHLTTSDGKALPIVHNKKVESPDNQTEYYLQYFPQTEKSESAYINEAGEIVPDAVVKPWLYAESKWSEFKPAVIAVSLSNIQRLAASGVIITMPELPELESLLVD